MKEKNRETLAAYLFIAPSLLGFLAFIGLPVLAAVGLSFTRYDILTPARFVGFGNFASLFEDARLYISYTNTVKFLFLLIPINIVIGLLLALGVHSVVSKGLKYLFRTVFFFPTMVTTASVALAWGYLLNKDYGVINFYLGKLGVDPIPWLSSAAWSIPAIVLFSIWKGVGSSFIFFLVGLQNIPRDYFEAAQIDGANSRTIFRRITLPLLTPTVFFITTMGLIGGFQIFDEPFLITKGGPGDSSRTINMYIYEHAFQFFEMGYASAVSLTLFVIILSLTICQFWLGKRWVHYQ
jgi:multiple sugar transport system permease protein